MAAAAPAALSFDRIPPAPATAARVAAERVLDVVLEVETNPGWDLEPEPYSIDLDGPIAAITVGQLTQHLTLLIRTDVILCDVWVRGEISNLKPAASGHLYFTLKDDDACVPCVMWRAASSRLPFRPASGMQVVARGAVDVYGPRGAYQLVCSEMQPDGLGAQYLALEQSKARLQEEGLLDAGRKRPLPACPRRVAVITSLSGAAVRDVCVILTRSPNPPEIVLLPALMQGGGAEAQILEALERANTQSGADLIVVARGGGSIEDLWTFNSERLARAIAASRLPVISAIGHETDFTLIDFTADLRAPTPTAAAEIIAARRADVERRCETAVQRAAALCLSALRGAHWRLESLANRPVLRRPERLLDEPRQRLDEAVDSLRRAVRIAVSNRHSQLGLLAGRLEALSPLATLTRGYGLVTRLPDETRVRSVSDLAPGEAVRVRLTDGAFDAQVTGVAPHAAEGTNR